MSRKTLLFCLIPLLLSACQLPASTPAPTEPALNFPSPAPGATPLCRPGDLQTSANSSDIGQALILGLTLTNHTKNPCALTNPPVVNLLDGSGQPLEIETSTSAPAQTPPAPVEVVLTPGGSVILSLVWENYCQQLPASLRLRLALGEQEQLETAIPISSEPQCTAQGEASTLLVAPYSYPP